MNKKECMDNIVDIIMNNRDWHEKEWFRHINGKFCLVPSDRPEPPPSPPPIPYPLRRVEIEGNRLSYMWTNSCYDYGLDYAIKPSCLFNDDGTVWNKDWGIK